MSMKTTSSEFGKTINVGVNTTTDCNQGYYILEHLVGSQYHQAGEKQEIMLDEVILGRNPECQVRFDDSFQTVSRRHASIVKDGDNWRLNQLSQKNTTYLNGKPVPDSWYLQSGDEIQLATNGPKLIFRIPTETPEFSVSQKLNSFKDQVIKPYKTAFIIVCCVIALIIAGGITAGVIMKQQRDMIQQLVERNEKLYDDLMNTNELLEQTALRADAAQQEAIKAKSLAFKEKAERIKSQENLQEVQTQMEQLREEMNSFYNGIINSVNQ